MSRPRAATGMDDRPSPVPRGNADHTADRPSCEVMPPGSTDRVPSSEWSRTQAGKGHLPDARPPELLPCPKHQSAQPLVRSHPLSLFATRILKGWVAW